MNFKETLYKFSKKSWDYLKIARLELIVILAIIVFDLVTKTAIAANMYEHQTITLIPNFLNITFVINTKAAFSFDFGLGKIMSENGVRIVFLIITGIAMVVFAFFMYRARGKHIVMRMAFALIIAGGLGNFFDRLFLAGVRDFIEIVFFGCKVPLLGESFAIFNFADASLTIGVAMFLVYYIFIYKEPKKEEELITVAEIETAVINNDGSSLNGKDNEVNVKTAEDIKETAALIENLDVFDDGDVKQDVKNKE